MGEAWIWQAALGGLGLIFGSFIATIVTRWPEGRSALAGRSMCDACGRTLTAAELVPVLSFVVLRGRCRGCDAPVAPIHLAIELAAGAIGLLAASAAPGPMGVAGAVFGWLLLALGALDYVAFWLPDRLTALLAAAGLIVGEMGYPQSLVEQLIGAAAGFGSLWIVREAYRRLRGREGLGLGDAKLFGAIGIWFGWQGLAPVLLFACALGLAAVLVLRLAGRRLTMSDRLPLGTLLAAAAWLLWFAATWGSGV